MDAKKLENTRNGETEGYEANGACLPSWLGAYTQINDVEERSYGRAKKSVFVPTRLAHQINDARQALTSGLDDDPEMYLLACVPLPPGRIDARSGASRRVEDELPVTQSSKTEPAPAKDAVPPVTRVVPTKTPTPPRKVAAHGRRVPVVTMAQLVRRKLDMHARFRSPPEERKAEEKLLNSLIERGPSRIVGLKRSWRKDLSNLVTDMPNFSTVIERVEHACALSEFARRPLRIPPLLLVGQPGIGKTHFATRLAAVLGVDRFLYALESSETASTLAGSDKHWSNTEHGNLFRLVMLGEFANPVVILDELDKAPTETQYRPADALHGLLEPETAKAVRDKSIDITFDASYVVYIGTCNKLSGLDASLLSRFEIVHVRDPDARASVSLARSIAAHVIGELGLARTFQRPDGEVIQQLALLGGPRTMHKSFRAAIGRAVVAGRRHVHTEDLLHSSVATALDDPSAGHRSVQ